MIPRLIIVALGFAPLCTLAYGEKDEHPCPQGHLPAVCCFEPTESSAALLHDGRWFWLATYTYGEYGDYPAIGVVRYDWTGDRIVPEADAMCGFLATGMVKLGDVLWLASDGGLSRRGGDGRWEHFVFRVGESPAVERTSCRAIYDLARATAGKDDPFDREVRGYRALRERARSAARAAGAGR